MGHNIPTLFENMINQTLLSVPVFALYLPGDASERGELVFGGIDVSHCADAFVDVPLISDELWEVSLDTVTFGGSAVISSAQKALFASGSSFMGSNRCCLDTCQTDWS